MSSLERGLYAAAANEPLPGSSDTMPYNSTPTPFRRGTSFRRLSALFAVLTALVMHEAALGDDVATYAQIKPSLALVAAGTGKRFGFGTAFCIESQRGYGFLLTNKHVVGNDPHPRVLLMSDPGHVHYAGIVRFGGLDAAVLAIRASCVPANLHLSAPSVGTKIAVAGFPAFQLDIFAHGLGLAPSFHEGTISSIIAEGAYLEYDAQTDHGNSGSPLFDTDTGEVYGLVTGVNTGTTGALQNNIAIGSIALGPFLQNARHDIEVGLAAAPDKVKPSLSIAPAVNQINSPATAQLSDDVFNTYIPLRERKQDYDCGSGRHYTMQIHRYGNDGLYFTVTETYSGFPSNPSNTTLQAYDGAYDILFMGVFNSDGSLRSFATTPIAVPFRASRSFEFRLTLPDGSTDIRKWSGSSTITVPSGRYAVQIYADTNDRTGTKSVTAYADSVGLVAFAVYRSKTIAFVCNLVDAQDL